VITIRLVASWVPLVDVAARRGISASTLRRWIRQGKLERHRPMGDRRVYVDDEEVARLMSREPQRESPSH
jgi:excisionase family DNA binding protein